MDKLINSKEIDVAVGILSNSLGQLLVAKRPDHWLGGGFWEFPGGKLEPYEDACAALKRELLEEIGILVHECTPLINLSYSYPERKVNLHAWKVHDYSGMASGLEGQEISWQEPLALNHLDMLPANRAIVVAVQLSDTYLITPECHDKMPFLESLEYSLQQGVKLVQFRSHNLALQEYIEIGKVVVKICRDYEAKLLLNHNNLTIIDRLEADGIQLRSSQLFALDRRPLPKDKWVGASCHNLAELKKAEELGVDFALLGPIKTLAKTPLGWDDFAKLVAAANIPIFALGGMTIHDLPTAKSLGAQGIAARNGLWQTVQGSLAE